MEYPHTNFKNDCFNLDNKRRSGSACHFNLSKLIGKIGRGASPNFNEEKRLWKRGFKIVAGLDEVGRGPLAGPVVACAVVMDKKFLVEKIKVKDSKQLSAKQREKLYTILTKHPHIKWGIGIVSERVIDKINILEATKLAMQKAIENLTCRPDHLILDGNFKIKSEIPQKSIIAATSRNCSLSQKRKIDFSLLPSISIIKGDTKVFSIATASIIAKVTRDRMMIKYDKKYPGYGFKKHKGYPTEFHRKRITELGFCKIHRRSFHLT